MSQGSQYGTENPENKSPIHHIRGGGGYGARVTNKFEVCSFQRDDYENYTYSLVGRDTV